MHFQHFTKLRIWYPKYTNFDLIGCFDANFAGSKTYKKSNFDTCQLMESILVSWNLMKQNSIVLSTIKAEYVVVWSCCTLLLWMKQQLVNYNLIFELFQLVVTTQVPLISSRISFNTHELNTFKLDTIFIRDHVNNDDVILEFIPTLQIYSQKF